MIRDFVMNLAQENWWLLVLIGATIAVVGAVLGMVRKATGRLFVAAVESGDRVADRLLDRPKAMGLIGIAVAIAVPSALGGRYLTPPKIEERVVTRTINVSDDAEIRRLSGEMEKAEAARLQADAGRRNAESEVTSARAGQAAMEEAKKQSDRHADALAEKLAKLTPPTSDLTEMRRLVAALDDAHFNGVQMESAPPEGQLFDFYKYKTVSHSGFNYKVVYHRNCRLCDDNLKTELAIQAIIGRRGWKRYLWENDAMLEGAK